MGITAASLIEALPCPVIVVDAGQAITYANGAAEYFFATSQSVLKRLRLGGVVPFSSPLIGLLAQVRQENDRISDLLDQMEVFSDDRPPQLGPVNLHAVLDHVEQLARAGFARGVAIRQE